ncbi:AAA family ATPase [Pontibacter silvestris]|uniref:AAA family ATPase n=1 Tax=Pontibacter silvestris TaxID=2305183 RepID=A0ABW4WW98_9BACT|nr:AAA family ATPase [Pontibacter silvestris]MCC9138863.1 AAA family ATPase [Pontibacter silvestris]
MKKITFIAQSKGGVGKSALTYMIANKIYRNKDRFLKTVFVDMDNETNTSATQVQFGQVNELELINPKTRLMDRSRLDKFFKEFALQEEFEHAVCDMGATTSEQFLNFLSDEGTLQVMQLITGQLDIKLEILCIVAGDNSFNSSASFCGKLFKGIQGHAELRIIKNNLFDYSDAQQKELEKMARAYNASVIEFGLLGNMVIGESIDEIKRLMQDGKAAIEDGSLFTKVRYKKAVEDFQYEC